MKKVIMTLIFLIVTVPLYAKEMIIFTGIPEMKISEGGVNRVRENLNKEKCNQIQMYNHKNRRQILLDIKRKHRIDSYF